MGIPIHTTQTVIQLLQEGNTVPFIARYRKEQTGGLDEVQIKDIEDKYEYGVQLSKRKEEVIRLIDEQGKLTEELQQDIIKAEQLQKVEDLYRPYKQKRRTRATKAKEKGLEPFASRVYQRQQEVEVEEEAKAYFSEEHELTTVEDVLSGVNDIIAEWISDEPKFREKIRKETFKHGVLETKVKDEEKDEKGIFNMYYDFHEPIRKIASHRVLAMNRGEKEDIIKVSITAPEEQIISFLQHQVLAQPNDKAKSVLMNAIEDGYKRLIEPSIEREIRNTLTEEAEEHAIQVFSKNLRNLLLQPPLKGKTVLGVDPAYRTGCKLAVVDETGKAGDIAVMYPTPPKNDRAGAEKIFLGMIEKYPVEIIAIGNGTASRETEQFIAEMIQKHNLNMGYIIVNEAGASVYSASKLAREEFPDLQVEERSAISIARRLQDPLSELVKIDPKSIGVGQYQHDVSQKKLSESLTFVVETVVNQVGVNVNTASASLLQYISGLNKTVATNIVKYRDENGKIKNRKQLKKVPRLGAKTYEQAIGFLRITDGDEPLDATPIHPESYNQTKSLLSMLELSTDDLGQEQLITALNKTDTEEIAEQLQLGTLTLKDIIEALKKPNRDPRDEIEKPILKKDVLSMEDLKSGMELQGTVRNVVDFGAFVDIGVKQDGLVHISKLSNQFVKHPLDVVAVGDIVTVWVDDVNIQRERIALTMLEPSTES
ncbi:Tex family protein [Salinibacillus xinjiangensis]|uniref:S1 RNA-binding domain-containing protein n=1 Tax=Salinibacillus xinjiangensis TaxID=1229268 RepID=A0A6G1X8F0_9BACI|nr:Tex family protein [Salinibacillus xinjiangensis]MRG87209.1 S1 RNA-binding domain-containing protein [Salinibacillus xinjiangensis]